MTFDVGTLLLDELLESRAAIEREIWQRARNELAELDARRADLLVLLGEEPAVPFHSSSKPQSDRRSVASTAKYRDPATGKTWSGKGKRPRWFDADRIDDLLIEAHPGDLLAA